MAGNHNVPLFPDNLYDSNESHSSQGDPGAWGSQLAGSSGLTTASDGKSMNTYGLDRQPFSRGPSPAIPSAVNGLGSNIHAALVDSQAGYSLSRGHTPVGWESSHMADTSQRQLPPATQPIHHLYQELGASAGMHPSDGLSRQYAPQQYSQMYRGGQPGQPFASGPASSQHVDRRLLLELLQRQQQAGLAQQHQSASTAAILRDFPQLAQAQQILLMQQQQARQAAQSATAAALLQGQGGHQALGQGQQQHSMDVLQALLQSQHNGQGRGHAPQSNQQDYLNSLRQQLMIAQAINHGQYSASQLAAQLQSYQMVLAAAKQQQQQQMAIRRQQEQAASYGAQANHALLAQHLSQLHAGLQPNDLLTLQAIAKAQAQVSSHQVPSSSRVQYDPQNRQQGLQWPKHAAHTAQPVYRQSSPSLGVLAALNPSLARANSLNHARQLTEAEARAQQRQSLESAYMQGITNHDSRPGQAGLVRSVSDISSYQGNSQQRLNYEHCNTIHEDIFSSAAESVLAEQSEFKSDQDLEQESHIAHLTALIANEVGDMGSGVGDASKLANSQQYADTGESDDGSRAAALKSMSTPSSLTPDAEQGGHHSSFDSDQLHKFDAGNFAFFSDGPCSAGMLEELGFGEDETDGGDMLQQGLEYWTPDFDADADPVLSLSQELSSLAVSCKQENAASTGPAQRVPGPESQRGT